MPRRQLVSHGAAATTRVCSRIGGLHGSQAGIVISACHAEERYLAAFGAAATCASHSCELADLGIAATEGAKVAAASQRFADEVSGRCHQVLMEPVAPDAEAAARLRELVTVASRGDRAATQRQVAAVAGGARELVTVTNAMTAQVAVCAPPRR
jgi:hypothetical protein